VGDPHTAWGRPRGRRKTGFERGTRRNWQLPAPGGGQERRLEKTNRREREAMTTEWGLTNEEGKEKVLGQQEKKTGKKRMRPRRDYQKCGKSKNKFKGKLAEKK